MSATIGSPWISRYLTRVAKDHGSSVPTIPRVEKAKRVQLTKFLTISPEVWLKVSDVQHQIPVRLSAKAVAKYESLHVSNGIRLTEQEHAIVLLNQFRPIWTRIPHDQPTFEWSSLEWIALEADVIEFIGSEQEPVFGNPAEAWTEKAVKAWMDTIRQETSGSHGDGSAIPKQQPHLPAVHSRTSVPHLPRCQQSVDAVPPCVDENRTSVQSSRKISVRTQRRPPQEDVEMKYFKRWESQISAARKIDPDNWFIEPLEVQEAIFAVEDTQQSAESQTSHVKEYYHPLLGSSPPETPNSDRTQTFSPSRHTFPRPTTPSEWPMSDRGSLGSSHASCFWSQSPRQFDLDSETDEEEALSGDKLLVPITCSSSRASVSVQCTDLSPPAGESLHPFNNEYIPEGILLVPDSDTSGTSQSQDLSQSQIGSQPGLIAEHSSEDRSDCLASYSQQGPAHDETRLLSIHPTLIGLSGHTPEREADDASIARLLRGSKERTLDAPSPSQIVSFSSHTQLDSSAVDFLEVKHAALSARNSELSGSPSPPYTSSYCPGSSQLDLRRTVTPFHDQSTWIKPTFHQPHPKVVGGHLNHTGRGSTHISETLVNPGGNVRSSKRSRSVHTADAPSDSETSRKRIKTSQDYLETEAGQRYNEISLQRVKLGGYAVDFSLARDTRALPLISWTSFMEGNLRVGKLMVKRIRGRNPESTSHC